MLMNSLKIKAKDVLFLFTAVMLVSVSLAGTTYAGNSLRIVGGSEAVPGAWPWMAALVDSRESSAYNGFLCGASLVHSRWAVTAAHCVKEQFLGIELEVAPEDVDVVLDIHDLKNDTGQRISVKKIILHPSHSLVTSDSDIALLELEEDVLYQPIPLVAKDTVLEGKEALVIGWGVTDDCWFCEASETLQQASVPIVSDQACRESYSNEEITDNMLCAGYSEGGTDTCSGDSGGPLIVQEGDTWRLAGITSWGDGCGEPGYYGVYTRVSQFIDFIYEYVPNLRISLPESAAEGDGLLTASGTVDVPESPDSDLAVNLSSDSPSEITIPAQVTITAGSTSASFDITVLDDDLLDGTQTVTVTASDLNDRVGTGMIKIDDNETAVLDIRVPESAAEGDGLLRDQGTVTVSSAPDRDISVFLTSHDTTEVSVPEAVTIPAGETAAAFDITIIYDGENDGTQTVLITASVPGWTPGTGIIEVAHNEIDFFTEQFDVATDLAYQTLTFTPDRSGNFYTACRETTGDFPTDPAGGTPVDLGDDDNEQISLSEGAEIFLYGTGYSSFYAGSNGYITFSQGDDSAWESLAAHFELPRISGLFTDLYPAWETVTWKQEYDRVAVTYQDIPEYSLSSGISEDTSSFQIEMFFDGVIRITYLEISADDGIAGLSGGDGIPQGFSESDLSGYGSCGPSLSLDIPESAAEGDGLLTVQGIVSTDEVPDTDLRVSLISGDTSEVTVPDGITIEAGRTSAFFDLRVSDDTLLDGTQSVTLTASASGYYDGKGTISITDNETAELTVNVPQIAVEGDGVLTGQGTVTVSRPADNDITISLMSDDTTEVTVPGTVTIPSGQITAAFDVTIIYDGEADDTQTAVITASVPGWTSGEDVIEVIHNPLKRALYFSDTTEAFTDPAEAALENKGYLITAADNYTDFETLAGEGGWDLIILMNQGNSVGNISAFLGYVADGGIAIMTDWSGDEELGSAFGVLYTGNENGESVLITEPALAEGITNPLPLFNPGYMTWSLGMASEETIIGEFPDGDAAVVIANEGKTAAVGFLNDTFEDENEAVRFYENLIGIISGKMLRLTVPENVTEGDGVLVGQGKVRISKISESDISITLTSEDISEISVPSEVIIPAYSDSAVFDITISDDTLLDGTQEISITASLTGWISGKGVIMINDNETAVLSVNLPERAEEGDGVLSGQGRVTVSRKADKDITVWLTSDDTTEVIVPETVMIPAGETTALFDITILYDGENDGTQGVPVNASVPGWTPGTDTIRVVHNNIDFFTEQFDGDNDMSYQTLTFTPDGSGNFYTVCHETTEDFPTDPAGGTPIYMGDDDNEHISLSGGAEIFFYGTGYSSFYACSNGYITFGQGDDSAWESLSAHFELPRISGLFTDLYPAQGTVTWKQEYDRVAVTYQDIPEYSLFSGVSEDTSSFQIEMFFDGVIRITYLETSANYCIAGLSRGNDLPRGFAESNFDGYPLCSSFNSLFINIPERISEDAGMLADQGQVTLERPADYHLIVELESEDTSEIIIPAAVLILEGESSATFDLSIIDDAVSDGVETVNIRASAENCTSYSESIQVMDKDAVTIAGDTDYNGALEIRDAILILKLLSGMKARHVNYESDVNGDRRIGMEEAIFILNSAAGR
ncbi:serine protease [Desulfococcaceae bacterium HSG8]|nr:serine protease [Desulfococcaceae bacterium HSG8]